MVHQLLQSLREDHPELNIHIVATIAPEGLSGKGLQFRKSLTIGRWQSILNDLRKDRHFFCHKTTSETGNGTNLLCAGAIQWQKKHCGQPSQLARIMQRIE